MQNLMHLDNSRRGDLQQGLVRPDDVDLIAHTGQSHGVAIHAIFTRTGADTQHLDEFTEPPELQELQAGLLKITALRHALLLGTLTLHWTVTGSLDALFDLRPDRGRPQGPQGSARPDYRQHLLSGNFVRRQLYGLRSDDGEQLLSTASDGSELGNELPFASGSIEILPIVVVSDADVLSQDGLGLGFDTKDPGAPYAVVLPSTSMGTQAGADLVAKAIGKLLGLGDESTELADLSAPDFWGRALPNLWVPPLDDPTADPPWGTAKVAGGFGQRDPAEGGVESWRLTEHAVYRPTASCLMGSRASSDGDFCEVCTAHLRSILLGIESDPELDPFITVTNSPLEGCSVAVDNHAVTLWDSIDVRRVDESADPPAVFAVREATGSTDAMMATTTFANGFVATTRVDHARLATGRAVIVTLSLEKGASVPADDQPATSPTPTPRASGSIPGTALTDEEPTRAQWTFRGGFATATTHAWYRHAERVADYEATLDAAAMGTIGHADAQEKFFAGHEWDFTVDSDDGLEDVAFGFSTVAGSDQPRATDVGTAIAVPSSERDRGRLWPTRRVATASRMLPLLVAPTVGGLDDARSATLGALTYIQAVGVSERLPGPPNSQSGWHLIDDGVAFELSASPRRDARLRLVWTEFGESAALRRAREVFTAPTPVPGS